ncbi:MAG: HAMP domain-containing sensor histidine kinase [Vicinamibacterales bacterium]
MGEQLWYRSLYWRIALGFVALLAVLLVLQGFVFLWMTGRMTELFPSRSPAQLAASIASDLSVALAEQTGLDADAYVKSHYGTSYHGYVVVLTNGTTIVSHRISPPPNLARMARGRLFFGRGGDRPGPDLSRGRGGRGRDFGPDRGEFGRGGPGRGGPDRDQFGPGSDRGGPPGGVEFANIVVNDAVVGVVGVPLEPPPFLVAVRDLGPSLGFVALALLATGTAVAALVIFRPTRRRLQQLQDAARALGAGEIGVRAPESGKDEVTALSRAFNEMAEQLETRTQALEQADRTRRQLLADVSHELTTPLAAIRGYVETLGMPDVRLDQRTRGRYLQIVTDEAQRLQDIIGDLLELARLEGGGGSLRADHVPVAYLLERVQHRHAPAVAERHIALATCQAPAAQGLVGDQNRLEQALQNLVANAIRHTPDRGTVTVSALVDDDALVLRVDDTGPGIDPEHLPHIFDRFYKADQSRTGTATPSGSGLGLSIVQAIVVRHGGTVRASNGASGGARVEIRLPMRRQA